MRYTIGIVAIAALIALGVACGTDENNNNGGADAAEQAALDATTAQGGLDAATTQGGEDAATQAGPDAATLPGEDAATHGPPDAAQHGPPDAGIVAGCNALQNVATEITGQKVASDAPAMTGGTIVDGVYTMTAMIEYTGTGGATGTNGTIQQTIAIAGNAIEVVREVGTSGAPPRFSGTFTLAGNTMSMSLTCPPGGPARVVTYTATATTLQMLFNGEVEVYTLVQP